MSEDRASSGLEEFKRHWLALIAATLGVGISITGLAFYTAGVFIGPLETEFGWSRASISSGNLALFWGVAIASPIAGYLIDRFGTRIVVFTSMLAMAAGFAALGLITGWFPGYVALCGALGFFGTGASAIAFTRIVSTRFEHARGLALGICLMGSGLAGFIGPPLIERVIAAEGWRAGYFALGGVIVLAIPLLLLLRDSDRPAGPRPAQRSAGFGDVAADYRFWILLAAVALVSFGSMGVVYHIVPILTGMGYERAEAASQAGVLGLAVLVTRIATGYALDRLHAPAVGAVATLVAAGACLLLAFGPPSASMAGVILMGMILGAEFDLMAFLTAKYFSREAYGRIYGVIFGASVLISGLAPFAIALIYDRSGDYRMALCVGAATLAAAAPLFLSLGRYPREAGAAQPLAHGGLSPQKA